jgi:hypothetical protein
LGGLQRRFSDQNSTVFEAPSDHPATECLAREILSTQQQTVRRNHLWERAQSIELKVFDWQPLNS